MGSDPTGALGAIRRRPWVSALGLLMLISAALLLTLGLDFGFFLDDWDLVIYREGSPTDWLLPHNEHIVVLPAAIYKLSLAVFGMNAGPLHVLAILLFLLSVGLLFLWLRPLIGEPASVIGCAVILFLGAATEDLIWAFQMGFFGSMAAGLGALLLLRVRSRRNDALACLMLVISLLFSSLGLPFAVGAALHILLRDDLKPEFREFLRRSWVFAIPLLVYGIWWLGWGRLAENAVSLHNAFRDPLYLLSSIAYSASIMTGTFPIKELNGSYGWAVPGLLLTLSLGLVVFWRRRIPKELLVAVVAGFTFWTLAGLNFIPGREFFSSRYGYPGAVFMLMILAGAVAGYRPGPLVLKCLGALAAFAVAVNAFVLAHEYRTFYKPYAEYGLAALTAFDLASRTVKPETSVGVNFSGTARVDAAHYLAATGEYGSPGLDEDEIDAASEDHRTLLDQNLVGTLPVSLLPASRVKPRRDQCRTVSADADAGETLELQSGLLYIRANEDVFIRLGRFGPGAGALAWLARGGEPTGYKIPRDNSDRAWRIGFQGKGPVTVCPARMAG